MRIVHVLSSFGMGGQERVALDLAREQLALGHHPEVVSLAPGPDGPLYHDFVALGVPAHTVPKRDGFDLTLPPRLARCFRRCGAEVVHTHNPQPLIYAGPAARLAGARLIHTKHGANPGGGRRLVLRRLAARLCDAYVAVSEVTADVAREKREVPLRKLHTIPNGIDLGQFAPDPAACAAVRAELGIPAGAFVAGTVGRLAPEKDQALLLAAAAPHLGDGFHLIVIGDGPERADLEARRAGLGAAATSVHLLGARRDVPRLLCALDLFVLSSRTEGLPLVLPEAMAAGLPVVSTAVGGIPRVVVEGETGHLVPAGDAAALGERLARLATPAGREAARRMGARGRALALERYSAARMARDYQALYEAAVGGRPPPA